MNILLKFDHTAETIFAPDGYIPDVNALHLRFFDWLHDEARYITYDARGHAVYSYDASAFLPYVNEAILPPGGEKAYILPLDHPPRGKLHVLKF